MTTKTAATGGGGAPAETIEQPRLKTIKKPRLKTIKKPRVKTIKVTPAKASKASAGGWAEQIMSAPKGVRSVSHRKIKAAVAKVFRQRMDADG
jgi:hypothetical protein